MSQADIKITLSVLLNPREGKAVWFTDGRTKVWIPKSQIRESEGALEKNNTVTITIPEWLAKKNGMI